MKRMVNRARHPLRFLKAFSPSSKASKPKVRRGGTQASLSKFVESNQSWTESEGTVVDAGHQFGDVKDSTTADEAMLGPAERTSLEGHVWITVTKEVDTMEEQQDTLLADDQADRVEQPDINSNLKAASELQAGKVVQQLQVEVGEGLGPPSRLGGQQDSGVTGLEAPLTESGSTVPEVQQEFSLSLLRQTSSQTPSNDPPIRATSPHLDEESSSNSIANFAVTEPLQDDLMAPEDSTLAEVEGESDAEQPVETIDPFLVDDPEDPDSDDVQTPRPIDASHSRNPSLLASIPTDFPATPFTPNPDSQFSSEHTHPLSAETSAHDAAAVRNDSPTLQPPGADPESDDDEPAPEFYLPSLTMPTMFLPIPNTDPLTTLLSKHISDPNLRPARDISGDWQNTDFHTLVMTNSWRALARMARDRIVVARPSEIFAILSLWYLRLSSLARLRFFNQTSAECNNLFSVLNSIEPIETRSYIFEKVVPFELDVLRARCLYWSGDHMAYLDESSNLLRLCRSKARKAKSTADRETWKERGARMCLIIASQLIEMKEYTAASSFLEGLCDSNSKLTGSPSSPALRSAIARIYLQGGNVAKAAHHMSIVENDPEADQTIKNMNAILLAVAYGHWDEAAASAQNLLKSDDVDIIAINNLAVTLLSQGKLSQAIETLEGALQNSPSAVTSAEPFLFNLSTLYELRAGLTARKKRDLLIDVAKWSGDGLKTACLKWPTN